MWLSVMIGGMPEEVVSPVISLAAQDVVMVLDAARTNLRSYYT